MKGTDDLNETMSKPAFTGRVLVVDDNRLNRLILSRSLAGAGHEVLLAEDGEAALAMIRAEPFDLVFLDIEMPVLDGYGVLTALRADERFRHLPVIVVSAVDDMASVVRCIELGAEDYLPKPFDPVLLFARTNACLEKKRLRDAEVSYLRRIEEEKGRADGLLHAIFPDPIVAELKATGTVAPRRHDGVAVLFCDIVGFTEYCDGRAPQEVVAHLQALFDDYEAISARRGVLKVKTTGDAFMVAAGLLEPEPDAALRCVMTGLEMVEAAQRLPPHWSVRAGVHVGPVMAGVLGRRSYLFDIWGDTVNTAQRLQSISLPRTVTVSAEAWAAVAPCCEGERLGPVDVKGKPGQVAYRVGGLRDRGCALT